MQRHLPLNMGEKVWEVRPEDVANIGKLFSSGEYSAQRTIAVAGSSVVRPQYIKTQIGAEISTLTNLTGVNDSSQIRYINGDVLSGLSVSAQGYIDFYNNLLTIIPEGNHFRMFGWLPFVDNKIPSLSKTSLSWLFGKKGYEVDTNMNGEERAFVVTGEMEKVFPMDIYPMQLLKACMAEDIEKMEALGIYEVIPEDFGLIDYASTSKIEAQEIIKGGIELMIKEVG
jgi:Na+-transporting NADH:ubiquinone oxidoreductase subunit A